MDVVQEMDAQPPLARGVDAMRALNSINDRLARSLLALHCDCETIELIADHFGVDYPMARRKIG